MVDYREIKDAKKLKAIPFTMEDVPLLSHGQQINISTDLGGNGLPTQLNIRHVDDMTIVQPAGVDHKALPWKFTGYVSPRDCRAWYLSEVEANSAADMIAADVDVTE